MAKPRVFISSTYYDLKHIRGSLDDFIETLGYEPIRSEKGDIAFTPDRPLDESCYRDAENADMFVLIIGGRYGSPASDTANPPEDAWERYDSITKKEYQAAATRDVPVYILIEQSVYAEHQTYCQNKDNDGIQYAQVDSPNVFRLIDDILAQRRNNPVHQFREYSDIEDWLREQWAGYFGELLRRTGQQRQLASLSEQVSQLSAITGTLQTYLEEVVRTTVPEQGEKLIEQERERVLKEAFSRNRFVEHVCARLHVSADQVANAMLQSPSYKEFLARLGAGGEDRPSWQDLASHSMAAGDMTECRALLGLAPFPDVDLSDLEIVSGQRRSKAMAAPKVQRRRQVAIAAPTPPVEARPEAPPPSSRKPRRNSKREQEDDKS